LSGCGLPTEHRSQSGPPQHLWQNLPPERVDEIFDYEIIDEDVQWFGLKRSIEANLTNQPSTSLLHG
jgi:hypothetical protein